MRRILLILAIIGLLMLATVPLAVAKHPITQPEGACRLKFNIIILDDLPRVSHSGLNLFEHAQAFDGNLDGYVCVRLADNDLPISPP